MRGCEITVTIMTNTSSHSKTSRTSRRTPNTARGSWLRGHCRSLGRGPSRRIRCWSCSNSGIAIKVQPNQSMNLTKPASKIFESERNLPTFCRKHKMRKNQMKISAFQCSVVLEPLCLRSKMRINRGRSTPNRLRSWERAWWAWGLRRGWDWIVWSRLRAGSSQLPTALAAPFLTTISRSLP